MIALIAAVDKNMGIGWKNSLPWHFPEDLRYFCQTTRDHTVIMGSKTFHSLGKPLPNRTNVVVTSHPEQFQDIETITDFDAYLQTHVNDPSRLFVIGGASIYKQTLPLAQEIYLTHIDQAYQVDTYFPQFDPTLFRIRYEKQKGILRFVQYERIKRETLEI